MLKEPVEIWKDIPGFEGCYQISNLGRVKSLSRIVNNPRYKSGLARIQERILKLNKDSNGYHTVSLNKDAVKKVMHVQYLVADAFLKEKRDGRRMVVDHRNNIRTDNRLSNLKIIPFRLNTIKDKPNYKNNSQVGIYFRKDQHRWISRIFIDGKTVLLGSSKDKDVASKMYTDKLNELEKKQNQNYA